MLAPHDISASLKDDRSKANVDRLVERMAREHFDFHAYLEHIDAIDLPVKWYMTWTLNHYLDRYPHIGKKKQEALWNQLLLTEHEGILRDYWRMFTQLTIDEDLAGLVYEKAVLLFPSQSYPVAIRVHALQCAFNIAKPYPELMHEIVQVMDDIYPFEQVSMQARLRKLKGKANKLLSR